MKKAKMKIEIELTFSGGLKATERTEVFFNLFNHIVRDIDTAGVVPDDCTEYTKVVKLTNMETGGTTEHKFE